MIKKKKILCFMPGTVGGSQRMMIALTKQLDPALYEVKVVVVQPEVKGISNFIPDNFELIHIKVRNIWDFAITKMIRLIRKESPDFLFSSIFYLNTRVLIAGKLTKVPVILRNDNYLAVMRDGQRRVAKHIYKWAKVVIMQQEEMKAEFKEVFKFPEEKMVVIHNPIDKDAIDSRISAPSPFPDDDSVNYVWAARFNNKKGQDVLAEAFVKMHDRVPNSHLYLVGRNYDNPEMVQKVKDIVAGANLDNYLHIVGFDPNPYKWIYNCDCFVLPSRLEGLPNALVEAMYLKKPVVATTCIEIIKRMVEDGYNGYLVPSEDTDAMADAMVKALNLKNFTMTYSPSKPEDFIRLFD